MVISNYKRSGSSSPDAQKLEQDLLYNGDGRKTGVTQNVVGWNAKIFVNYHFS